jgi:hypothetical protein
MIVRTGIGKPRGWLLLPLLAVFGCGDVSARTEKDSSEPKPEAGTAFDPRTAGTIGGQVTWDGALPAVAPLEVQPNPLAGEVLQKKQLRPNPNAPRIDPRTGGLANAIVFLRGIDPGRGRPWDHPSVRVEQRAGEFHVIQGKADSHVGFVRRGDRIEMVSRDRFFHSLHAGGAAFFTLTFPDPDRPLQRPLKSNGLVELTSAAGYFWMRAYLFVADHPYYTRTDSQGRFLLAQVPPGRCEIVCWLPSWVKTRHERDPESGCVARIFFAPALCRAQPVSLRPGETKQLALTFSASGEASARR